MNQTLCAYPLYRYTYIQGLQLLRSLLIVHVTPLLQYTFYIAWTTRDSVSMDGRPIGATGSYISTNRECTGQGVLQCDGYLVGRDRYTGDIVLWSQQHPPGTTTPLYPVSLLANSLTTSGCIVGVVPGIPFPVTPTLRVIYSPGPPGPCILYTSSQGITHGHLLPTRYSLTSTLPSR